MTEPTSLPEDRQQLIARWEEGEPFEFFHFYGHKAPKWGVDASCLSQWFVREFWVDGILYPTAEHWMMAEKARLFDDSEMLDEILRCDTPRDAKAYGRKVRGFDVAVWQRNCFEIVKTGNRHKFSQHEDLGEFLRSTVGRESDRRAVAESPGAYDANASDAQVSEDAAIYSLLNSASPTPTVILVEAAPRDRIWGIGMGKSNPDADDPTKWRGKNLLGFALTHVREELAR